MLSDAPYHADVCLGETPGRAYWATTEDALRIRLGHFKAQGAKGSVLLFPGRTEYIEKYALAAHEFAQRGFASLVIDWRGQGLADRMLEDPRVGHVVEFRDYQKDVRTMLAAAKALDLPKPWYLLAHSMGGCIGLRALIEGLPVDQAAFTGPMWGINIKPHLRPVAAVLKHLLPAMGFGHITPPTTVAEPYVLNATFDDNMLTRDPEMWNMMRNQVLRHPDISLGGPSIIWLREALAECDWLHRQPSPKLPCVTYLGAHERIVETTRIHSRMSRWSGAHLEMIAGAEHEVMMEGAPLRTRIFDDMAQRFSA
jgi:lysophospholipase